MTIRAFTWHKYHGRTKPGSTRLRVDQLMKYWPEYKEYQYGEKVDVMVYQKVYIQDDWRFMEHFKGIQILDICDPDWLSREAVKQTLDCMDGAVCPTPAIADFLKQLTDKPIKIIPDRHDLELIPPLKTHKGKIKKAVWFGYEQNAEILKGVFPSLQDKGIELTIFSNDNPQYLPPHKYQKFDPETIAQDLQEFDICVLPQGNRPQDRFKSDNKTTLAWLCGLPVVKNTDDLEAMMEAKKRNEYIQTINVLTRQEYDVKKSVQEMKEFIQELKNDRT